jgi:hypothetical protein
MKTAISEERGKEIMATIAAKFHDLNPTFNQRTRRLWVAAEARSLGRGATALVAAATGVSQSTIRRGQIELRTPADMLPHPSRIRKAGGGRKRLVDANPALASDLRELLEATTRGDPQSPLRWCCKSLHNITGELRARGHEISHQSVASLMHGMNYSLKANKKTLEGASHPDRDEQFRYINERCKTFLAAGEPVISIDCKKKELVGNFKNGGREWSGPDGETRVLVHDFVQQGLGKAIPFGVYDLSANVGFVNVGMDHDTAAFATATLGKWWTSLGREMYPGATQLQITADGGGSNNSRSRLWKAALQKFADEFGLVVHVSHFPPGTSKWNKIEHRLFSHISVNWRGQPLVSYETVVSLIGGTTTRTGLRVRASLDAGEYPIRLVVSDEQMASLRLERHEFHGDWNYTIYPRT